MAFLDRFVDRFFKTDSEGRTIFYCSGWFWGGRGYIVPDESRKQQIHRFVRHYYTAFAIVILIWSALLAPVLDFLTGGNPWWVPWAGVICLSLVLGLVCQVWYFLSIARLVRGLSTARVKYTLSERLNDEAKLHIAFWWTSLAFFVLLTGLGIAVLLKGEVYAGLGGIVLFGCFLMMTAYMIWLKKRGSS